MPATDRPNVVIVMTDEQKATSLPMYGNPIVRTPHLERLAQDGVLFDHAFATYPVCVPNRVAVMTGRYPHATRSSNNRTYLQPDERHLPQIFAEHGYRTGLCGKNHCFLPEDLARFDHVWEAGHVGPNDPPTPEAAAAKRWIVESQVWLTAWGAERNPYPPEALGTALITDQAIQFVERYRDEPFFLWYSIADPHTPLQTASPYAEMYPPEEVDLPPLLDGEIETKPPAQQLDYRAMACDKASEEVIRRAISIYYGMNTYIDDQVGRFLARLEEFGLRDNTIVIYTSDHGDYVGEHRMIRKSKALYDCLCRVPLIVAWPGAIRSNARCDEFVCGEDILPTLMDLLGWPVPTAVQGQSFQPLLAGTGERYVPREAIYGEHGSPGEPAALQAPLTVPEGALTTDFRPGLKIGGRGRIKSIRTKEWKLVVYPGQVYGELYHLTEDPWELYNLYGQEPYQAVVADLRAKLLDWMIESEDCVLMPDAQEPGKKAARGVKG
jgi:arylsulfatase A-like enzyme